MLVLSPCSVAQSVKSFVLLADVMEKDLDLIDGVMLFGRDNCSLSRSCSFLGPQFSDNFHTEPFLFAGQGKEKKPGAGAKDTVSSSRNCSFPQATGYALILGALRNDSVEGASAIDEGWTQKRAVAVTLVTSAAASFATVGLLTLESVWYVLVSILGVPANVKFLVLPFVLVGSFVLFFAALVGDFKVCGAFLRSSSGRAAAFVRVSHKGLVISSAFALEGMRALVSRFSVIEGLNRHVLAGSLFSGTGEQASGRVDVPGKDIQQRAAAAKDFICFFVNPTKRALRSFKGGNGQSAPNVVPTRPLPTSNQGLADPALLLPLLQSLGLPESVLEAVRAKVVTPKAPKKVSREKQLSLIRAKTDVVDQQISRLNKTVLLYQEKLSESEEALSTKQAEHAQLEGEYRDLSGKALHAHPFSCSFACTIG